MKTLEGKIAIVAGASRGAGRGIALALGQAGATVYVAGRTSRHGPKRADRLPGTVEDTADEVAARGGRGIAVPADLSDHAQVASLFERVEREHGRVDLLANAAWYDNSIEIWGNKFWTLGGALWASMMRIIDAHWLASLYAARMMVRRKCGLIVFVTDHAIPHPAGYYGQMMWDVGHHAVNRLAIGMGAELKTEGVAVMGVNPGFMRTERVVKHMRESSELRKPFRFDLSETTEYVGRAVAALAADREVLKKSGELLWAADLAKEYGFTDVDGRYIPRFSLDSPVGEI